MCTCVPDSYRLFRTKSLHVIRFPWTKTVETKKRNKFHTPPRNHLSGRFPSFPLPLEKDNSLWSPLNCSGKKSLLFTFFPINLFFLNLVLVNHLFLTLFQSRLPENRKRTKGKTPSIFVSIGRLGVTFIPLNRFTNEF